jgi:hypothetical protein
VEVDRSITTDRLIDVIEGLVVIPGVCVLGQMSGCVLAP